MKRAQQRRYTLDEYFIVETDSRVKHEYLDGAILAMAGASIAHNRITTHLVVGLGTALSSGPCSVFGSDLRVATPSGLFTYPDLTVVCGRVALVPDRPDTVTNPTALVEVLSPSTRDYDQGEKLEHYLAIPSLREVLFVDQDRIDVRRLSRNEAGWSEAAWQDLADKVELAGVDLPLREVYREVFS